MIRPADAARDAAACAAIYAPYVETPASFEGAAPDAEEMRRRIATLGSSHGWFVEERDGRVAGFAYGGPHRARAGYDWAADVSVYLDADVHRQGIGRALYEALFALLRERGFRVLCAGITLPNAGSVGLHESLGFTPVGVYRAIGWKAGAWRDVGWWQLQLAPQDERGADAPPAPPR